MLSSLGVKLLSLGVLIECVLQIDSWCVSTTYRVEFPGYSVLGRDSCHQGSTSYMVSTFILVEASAIKYTRWMYVSAWEVGTSYRSVCGIIAGGGGVCGEISLVLGSRG